MPLFSIEKQKDRFEIYIFGLKLTFYRYLRMLRETYLMLHYSLLKDTLKTKFDIALPKEAYHHLSGDVELVEIPLKDILVPYGHKRNRSIPETRIYKWLESNGKSEFKWKYNEANVYVPESKQKAQKRMEKLAISLFEKYDPSVCAICVRKNNILIDGQHRAAALYHKYGGDYKVLVVREK